MLLAIWAWVFPETKNVRLDKVSSKSPNSNNEESKITDVSTELS